MPTPKHRGDYEPKSRVVANVRALQAKTALKNDARNRALRTLVQNLALDVAAAVAMLLLPAFTSAHGWSDVNWRLLGFLVAKTAAVTALSYLMRTVLDKSKVPTPLPPSDPGEPDAE